MRPYPKYKDSGVEWIGDVPEHWSALRLKWVCNFLYGESLSAQEREDGTIPVYGSNGIVGYHNRSITEKPCIIVGRKGSFGKVTFSEKKCYPIDTTYYIDCTSTKNYMRWLWYLLPLLKMDEFSRDSAVPGLNREDAYRNIVTLPSSYEQQQIIAYLDRKTTQIDDLISKKQKLTNLLKEERAAIINKAVTKGLNPDVPMKDSGIERLGEIPAHWEVKRLKYVIDLFDHKRVPLSGEERGKMTNKIYDYYGASGIIDRVDDYIFDGEYILIGEDGANLLARNSPLAFKAIGKFWVNNHAHILKPKYGSLDYFTNLLESIDYTIWVSGSAQPKLTAENLANIEIIEPPLKDQTMIVQFIEEKTTKIDQTTSKINKQINLLQEYRTALISEVVTGKIDVRT